MLYLASVSYSLYLWHWGILVVGKLTIGDSFYSLVLLLILSFIIGHLSFHFLERKFAHPANRHSLVLDSFGVLKLVAAVQVSLGLLYLYGGYLFSGSQLTTKEGALQGNLDPDPVLSSPCQIKSPDATLDVSAMINRCTFTGSTKTPSRSNHVWFVGDSHTGSLFQAYPVILDQLGDFTLVSHVGCPFPLLNSIHRLSHCNTFSSKVRRHLQAHIRPGDYVVIDIYLMSHLGPSSWPDTRHQLRRPDGSYPKDINEKTKLYVGLLDEFASSIKDRGATVILVGPKPRNSWFELTERQWFRPVPNSDHLFNELTHVDELEHTILMETSQLNRGNLKVLSMNRLSQLLKPDLNNYLEYFKDGDHVSKKGAVLVIDQLVKSLK